MYTVTSRSALPTAATLRAADAQPVPAAVRDAVRAAAATRPSGCSALRAQITAAAPTTYDKIRAIEAWLGDARRSTRSTRRSRPRGVDVVDDFLFRSRVGWCEQVASSLVVMARSVGIPARLATGFVPGHARRAHRPVRRARARRARVGRDLLPRHRLAGVRPDRVGPARGRRDARAVRGCRPRVTTRSSSACSRRCSCCWSRRRARARRAAGAGAARRRRRAGRAHGLHRLERIGRRAGRPRAPAETPREYAAALAAHLGDDASARGRRHARRRRFLGAGASPSATGRRRRGAILALTVKGIL